MSPNFQGTGILANLGSKKWTIFYSLLLLLQPHSSHLEYIIFLYYFNFNNCLKNYATENRIAMGSSEPHYPQNQFSDSE